MSRANIFVLFVTLMALLGCQGGHHTIYAEPELRESTALAVNAWEEKLDRMCPSVSITLVNNLDDADLHVKYGRVRKGLAAAEMSGIIVIGRDAAQQFAYTVPAMISHEIGHALGWTDNQHSNNEEDIMHTPLAPERDHIPTIADVHWVCSYWNAGAP